MNIDILSDKELLNNTHSLVKKERKTTSEILEHLEEIERRRLFCDLKYSSLFEYCTKELKYSEAQTYRRIDAMRLGKRIPKIKEGISQGELTLTNVNLLSDLFKKTDIKDKKRQEKIVLQMSNTSKVECERKIESIKKQEGIKDTAKKEIRQKDGEDKIRLHISMNKKTMEKINQLKGLLVHEKKYSTDELIDLMADHLIEKLENKKFKAKRNVKEENKNAKRSRYIKKRVKEEVYLKSNKQCINCGSTFGLEFDHKNTPYARGGSNNADNLQLLCRNCNTRKSIFEYGQDKMDMFINPTTPGKVRLTGR